MTNLEELIISITITLILYQLVYIIAAILVESDGLLLPLIGIPTLLLGTMGCIFLLVLSRFLSSSFYIFLIGLIDMGLFFNFCFNPLFRTQRPEHLRMGLTRESGGLGC
jgi:tellurite resistance protein TehA-like permease